MYWLEVAVFTVVFLIDCIRVSILDNSSSVDCVAPEPTSSRRHSAISEFDFSRTTDGTYTSPCILVNLRKSVLHPCPVGKVVLLDCHS
jgi:hypothetical protein